MAYARGRKCRADTRSGSMPEPSPVQPRIVRRSRPQGLSTRSVTDPVFPPAEAVIVTVPSRIPVTNPVFVTVARFVLELTQVNVTPGIARLPASYAVAVS